MNGVILPSSAYERQLCSIAERVSDFNLAGLEILYSLHILKYPGADAIVGRKDAEKLLSEYSRWSYPKRRAFARRGAMLFIPRIHDASTAGRIADMQIDDNLILHSLMISVD